MRAAEVRIVIDQGAISLLARDNVNVITAMDYLSGVVLQEMKARCPVSPGQPVYTTKGRTVPGGSRLAGGLPLRPSGYLRSSCRRLREPDGGYIIGPTADYALYVNNGTPPHVITSHGPSRRGTGRRARCRPANARAVIAASRPAPVPLGEAEPAFLLGGVPEGGDELVAVPLHGLAELDVEFLSCRRITVPSGRVISPVSVPVARVWDDGGPAAPGCENHEPA